MEGGFENLPEGGVQVGVEPPAKAWLFIFVPVDRLTDIEDGIIVKL